MEKDKKCNTNTMCKMKTNPTPTMNTRDDADVKAKKSVYETAIKKR